MVRGELLARFRLLPRVPRQSRARSSSGVARGSEGFRGVQETARWLFPARRFKAFFLEKTLFLGFRRAIGGIQLLTAAKSARERRSHLTGTADKLWIEIGVSKTLRR